MGGGLQLAKSRGYPDLKGYKILCFDIRNLSGSRFKKTSDFFKFLRGTDQKQDIIRFDFSLSP
jgi:hypothetical protein